MNIRGLMIVAISATLFYGSCFLGVRASVREYQERRGFKYVCQALIEAGYDVPLHECTTLFRDAPDRVPYS